MSVLPCVPRAFRAEMWQSAKIDIAAVKYDVRASKLVADPSVNST